MSARVDLPDGVTYVATDTIDFDPYGVLRTLAQDPAVRSNNPAWGAWTLNAPAVQADGTVRRPFVDITFTVNVNARPGTLKLTPHVFSDSADGELVGKCADLGVGPSGHLTLSIAAVPNRVKREDDVTYLLTVNNDGSGPSTGVDVLITLPDILAFTRTERTRGERGAQQRDRPGAERGGARLRGLDDPTTGKRRPGTPDRRLQDPRGPLRVPGPLPGLRADHRGERHRHLGPRHRPDQHRRPPPPTPTPSPSPSPSPTARGYHRPSPSRPTGH